VKPIAITDYERGIKAPTLVFGVKISIRAVSTWKRSGGSAANPQETVGNIVLCRAEPAPVSRETAHPNHGRRSAK
jgi:hypothetical protein